MVGKNEDFIREPHEDLGVLDREMLPRTFRLDIPIDHSRDLRRSAVLLRALAGRLEFLSAQTADDERSLLFQAVWAGKMCRRQLIKNIVDSKTNKVARHKILR